MYIKAHFRNFREVRTPYTYLILSRGCVTFYVTNRCWKGKISLHCKRFLSTNIRFAIEKIPCHVGSSFKTTPNRLGHLFVSPYCRVTLEMVSSDKGIFQWVDVVYHSTCLASACVVYPPGWSELASASLDHHPHIQSCFSKLPWYVEAVYLVFSSIAGWDSVGFVITSSGTAHKSANLFPSSCPLVHVTQMTFS